VLGASGAASACILHRPAPPCSDAPQPSEPPGHRWPRRCTGRFERPDGVARPPLVDEQDAGLGSRPRLPRRRPL